jgi:hypothetical protein
MKRVTLRILLEDERACSHRRQSTRQRDVDEAFLSAARIHFGALAPSLLLEDSWVMFITAADAGKFVLSP